MSRFHTLFLLALIHAATAETGGEIWQYPEDTTAPKQNAPASAAPVIAELL